MKKLHIFMKHWNSKLILYFFLFFFTVFSGWITSEQWNRSTLMNWLMCLDINFIPQNNFSCKINTMNCKFICQFKKKRCMEWYKTMLYFQSYITCILIIFSQNVIWRKYFLQIEHSWTWNHKKISQRAVEHELQLNCCLFLCFEYTDFFPQYN